MRRFARLLRETCERHGVGAQLWLPSFGLTRDEIPELEAAVAGAREEGVDDLWTWGYEACGHMTHLATPDAPLVWEAVSAALTGGRSAEEACATRELDAADARARRLLNVADATVAAAVAEAGDALAAAIDAIAARLARGGRLVYVGAGTSGGLAALDAAECGPTFGSPPGEVVAIVAGDGEDAEDDAERGDADVRAARRRRGGRGRRRQRERLDAVHARRARGRARGRVRSASPSSCVAGSALGGARRARDRRSSSGPEVVAGLDAPEGGHGAEARR